MLEPILGEDLYFGLLEVISKYEVEERLLLPILDLEVFREIWQKIKAQLRLKDAQFDEDSLTLEEMKIALSPRTNYFFGRRSRETFTALGIRTSGHITRDLDSG